MAEKRTYVWCTYRDWSFKILEAIQDLDNWKTGLLVTVENCIYDFENIKKSGIPILRVHPNKAKKEFQKGGSVYEEILRLKPETIITPGWSWYIPNELLDFRPCVTYHPGKLPKDRGGSPIQNQMRNGETWTYVNVMKQEAGLDEGPVYLRKKIALDGYVDDVWKRMTSAGVMLTRQYLQGIGSGRLKPEAQSNEPPTIYNRVTSADAELKPSEQTANQMFNIVRAHYETDPNTYVVHAHVHLLTSIKIEIYKATLDNEFNRQAFILDLNKDYGNEIHSLLDKTNNKELTLVINDKDNSPLYITQANIKLNIGN